MPLLYSPYYRTYQRRERERREMEEQKLQPEETLELIHTSDSSSDEEAVVSQTFPALQKEVVIRQTGGDLTCGMRSLQNLFGLHIVNREEMDNKAAELENSAFGIEMYDKELGYYHAEVLQSILTDKGKCVQRVDPEKMSSDYFHAALALNPLFSGYVVAVDTKIVKHYVAIRFRGGHLRKFDSLPGVSPVDIPPTELFRVREDGRVYCSVSDTDPVVAILAVGGTPFVEYTLMHDTWSPSPPSSSDYIDAIQAVLQKGITPWHKSWARQRIAPNEETHAVLKACVLEHISSEMSIVVKYKSNQTLVRCKNIEELFQALVELQWLRSDKEFSLTQEGHVLDAQFDSMGPLHTYGIDGGHPIVLSDEGLCSNLAQVGGFYQFDSSVSGKCIGTQRHAYSVRDTDGTVHVVYKQSIEHIHKIK